MLLCHTCVVMYVISHPPARPPTSSSMLKVSVRKVEDSLRWEVFFFLRIIWAKEELAPDKDIWLSILQVRLPIKNGNELLVAQATTRPHPHVSTQFSLTTTI